MIDPRFNELPDKTPAGEKNVSETELAAGQKTGETAKPRAGLSINDTIAGDANLSVGSRGTDTSGVRAGAGAPAGSSYVSPASGESPAPTFVSGSRGSGTTPLGDSASEQRPAIREGSDTTSVEIDPSSSSSATNFSPGSTSTSSSNDPSFDEIASHAYRCWHERGCPEGSPEHDWHRAEQELRDRQRNVKTSSATA